MESNRRQALARLNTLTQALRRECYLEDYDEIIRNWEADGIVEKVPVEEYGHQPDYFLPHRHVVKQGSTTPVRPVFDASSKVKGGASLNECLEKGPNLLELIPAVLTRFRWKRIGIISDILKAFLQISVKPQDRKVLQFLWWTSAACKELQAYRHCRVVFGVNSSPFLLAATLRHHLKKVDAADIQVAEELLRSFYVDNSVSSHDSMEEAIHFREKSKELLASAQMDLRGWEHGPSAGGGIVTVLGMLWDTATDRISLSLDGTMKKVNGEATKRGLLAAVNAIFDPMGFCLPFTIVSKFLFQRCCELEMKWDDALPADIAADFGKWKAQVPVLSRIWIPRWICKGAGNMTLHVFSDASRAAFSSCIFVRTEGEDGRVGVQLVMCRTRVAPVRKKVTIPRLELLGCLIGVRLAREVRKYLELEEETKCYFWTDSSTALAWICNSKPWARFVQNRVEEIRRFSSMEEWRHVPGELNPADLPSRGCSAEKLMQLQWWEGPEWLRLPEEKWPCSSFVFDREEVLAEARKIVVSAMAVPAADILKRLERFSSYHTWLRIVALVLRYKESLRKRIQLPEQREKLQLHGNVALVGECTAEEIEEAEVSLLRYLQERSFKGLKDEKLRKCNPYYDEKGLVRTKSQLFFGCEEDDVRCPVVLPSKHPIVTAIILAEHDSSSHPGVSTLMAKLRNRYWILKCRRAVSSVVGTCLLCRRYSARRCDVPSAPLPKERVTPGAAFQTTGVDLLGPLILFGGEKVWIALFTCAVYRCVHLEVTPTLSTEGFLRAFRRFVARRGRPKRIYSDNGLNFVGAFNLFHRISWKDVQRYAAVERMEWVFNPPTASWWGGWWERLVGLTKTLLRRVLGNRVVALEELATILCEVEDTLNQRPLTYFGEEDKVVPLSPSMFLRDNLASGLPEAEACDARALRGSAKRVQHIREQLRGRLVKEYLGQLKHTAGTKNRAVGVGDVVLIEHEEKKRVDWPWGVVKQLLPGRDGKVRKVIVSTKDGEFLRPIQRLFLLETALTTAEEPEESPEKVEPEVAETAEVSEKAETEESARKAEETEVKPRAGRVVKNPDRL